MGLWLQESSVKDRRRMRLWYSLGGGKFNLSFSNPGNILTMRRFYSEILCGPRRRQMSTNKQRERKRASYTSDRRLRTSARKPEKFLESWASEAHFALDTLDHIPIYELDEVAADICLVVINVGASSVEDPAMQGQLEELRQRMPDAPLVIMSDRDGSGDVIATLRAGARGFISSRMDPHVMLRALDFIIGGGVFSARRVAGGVRSTSVSVTGEMLSRWRIRTSAFRSTG